MWRDYKPSLNTTYQMLCKPLTNFSPNPSKQALHRLLWMQVRNLRLKRG